MEILLRRLLIHTFLPIYLQRLLNKCINKFKKMFRSLNFTRLHFLNQTIRNYATKYTTHHEWIRFESGEKVTIGISDQAQKQLGDMVLVELSVKVCFCRNWFDFT